MNKAYRVKYNAHTDTYVAVAEITRSQGKSSKINQVLSQVVLGSGLGLFSLMAWADAPLTDGGGTRPTSMAAGQGVALGTSCANSSSNPSQPQAVYLNQTGSETLEMSSWAWAVSAWIDGNGALAMGTSCDVAAVAAANAVALGAGAGASSNAVAIGNMALAQRPDTVAIGNFAQATAPNSVALGNGSVANRANTFSVGSETQLRQITNVAQGTLATDAVNKLQMDTALAQLSNALSSPSFSVSSNGGNTYAVVQDAVVDFSSGDANVAIKQIGDDFVFGLANAVSINQSLTVAGKVTINSDGRISNVANAMSSSDVVNKQQLDAASLHFISINSNNAGANTLNYNNKGAEGDGAIAIGTSAQAIGTASIALGNTAQTSNDQAIAIGNGAQANRQSLAIGTDAGLGATGTNNVFIGYNTKPGVGAGNNNTVLGSNAFYNGSGKENTYLGSSAGNQSSGSDNTVVGHYAGAVGKGSQNAFFGHQAGYNASGNSNASFGYTAGYGVKGDYNVATGYTSGRGIQGHHNVVSGSYAGSSLSGSYNVASGTYAAIGMNGSKNLVMGYAAGLENFDDNFLTGLTTTASNAVILGAKAYVKSDNSVALGANSVALAAVATDVMNIAGGTYAMAGKGPVGSVSIGSVGKERTLTNLAAGRVSNSSTDAVNGSQLYALTLAVESLSDFGGNAVLYDNASKDRITLAGSNGTVIANLQDGLIGTGSSEAINGEQLHTAVSSIANTVGGGSVVNADGSISAPQYIFGGGTYTTIGDALTNLDGRVSTNTQNIANNTQNISNNIQSINNLANSISQGTFSVSANGEGNAVAVAQGEIIDFGSSDGNVVISQSGNDFAFGLVSNINVGGSINIANTVSISSSGINMGGTTLTGLLDGSSPSDAVTKSQLDVVIQTANSLSASVVTYDNANSKDRITLAGSNGTVIANLQDGLIGNQSTEAINGGQLYTAMSSLANTVGGGSVVNADGSISAPQYNIGGTNYTTIGGALTNLDGRVSTNTQNIANNTQNINTNSQNIASNTQNISNNTQSINNLANSLSQGVFSVSANGEGNAVAVAQGETIDFSSSDGNIVIRQTGNDFSFGLANSISIQTSLSVGNVNISGDSISIVGGPSISRSGINAGGTTLSGLLDGQNPDDAATKSQLDAVIQSANTLSASVVTYDSGSKDRITLAGGSAGTLISNLQDGSIASGSRDAINGGQLYQGLSSLANAIGGGATVNLDGSVSGPNYVIGGSTYTHVGGALTNLDGRVTANTQNITQNTQNINNLSNSISQGTFSVSANGEGNAVAVAQGETIDFGSSDGNVVISQNGNDFGFGLARNINVGGSINIANTVSISSSGINMGGTTLTGLLDGSSPSDAVTKAQLDAVIQSANTLSASVVTYDSTSKDRITLAGGSTGTLISNLQDGSVNASSQDAVSGRQLYKVSSSMADALGGGASVNADGTLQNPSYVLNGQVFSNVGGALSNLDGRVVQNTNSITQLDNRVNTVEDKVSNISNQLSQVTDNVVQYDDQAKNSVTLAGQAAQLSTNSSGDEVVVAGGTLIQNVANGVKASDAVNKGQLDASLSEAKSYTDKQIAQFTDNMGADLSDLENRLAITNKNVTNIQNGASGMVQVSQTASVTQPKITGDNALAIGSGTAAEGNNSVAVGNQSQAKANNSVALGAGSIADRDNSVSVGSEGQERQLTNVAAGTHATDAVNVGQLNQALTGMAGSVNHLNQRINQVEDNANAGVAAAIAIANLPQPSGAGEGWVSMAVGGYDNQSGYALGYSATSSSGRWVFKAAATGNSQGKLGGGAGVAFRLY